VHRKPKYYLSFFVLSGKYDEMKGIRFGCKPKKVWGLRS